MTEKVLPPRPSFAELPLDKSGPRGNIWGLFGSSDELGLLNYVTPEVTREAVSEIVHGIRICTDLPLDFFSHPTFGRIGLRHEIKQLNDWAVNDDTITFNPQSTTQWDGFRHFGYQDRKRYYNGCVQADIHNTRKLGVDAWHKSGGIATRGVLLDYGRWAQERNLQPPCLETNIIAVSDLKEIASSQNVTFRPGDILFIRSGFIAAYKDLNDEGKAERAKMLHAPAIGLEQSRETLEFLWESGLVAVAGDMPTLEAWPWANEEYWLHEWLLAGWGCPIGEYFDLEKLGSECKRLGKWTFFFTSTPLHVPGGVATPANGMAIL
ncbi:hypothetical protein K469DRAFT_572400 [Zopfia rhizophila CBS 207.26]|uniref:Cyclase n=1 Tax=Zopfia rhizophila CBS 207.26 TaxID=1314779 RepID=A0A6A6E6H9_9PEZI|nr:hypothetical protein K469DRAFT_572400 [Zopfia rhizophila CBS 207.26]